MATRIPRLPTTFWLVLGCGALCGAATAAASPPTAPRAAPAPLVEAAPAPAAAPQGVLPTPQPPPAVAPAEEPLVLRGTPAPAPKVTAASGGGIGLADLVAVLALLAAAAVVFVQWRKQRSEPTPADETLEVVSSARVGGRWQVTLMRVPGRLLVLGATDKGLSLLAELDHADPHAAPAPAPGMRPPVAAPVSAPAAPAVAAGRDEPPILDLDAYRRPPSRDARPAPTPPHPDTLVGEDDAFLDHLMARLANAQPAVIRATTQPADEREALRRRVQHYRRGPTRI